MEVKCGIDMVRDERIFAASKNSSFLNKIYHPSEIELAKNNKKRLVSIFAIKEATFKALKLDAPKWLDVEVEYDGDGPPSVPRLTLSNELLIENLISIDVSVSHEDGVTVALVTILLKDK